MRRGPMITALLLLLLLAGCGQKGPVRPLRTNNPGPVTALEVRQQGAALVIGWQLPSRNQDGSLSKTPPTVDIYRMTFDPLNDCPECFDRSTLLVSIEAELPAPAVKVGDRYLLHDRQVQADVGYQYKLVTRNRADATGPAQLLRLAVSEPVAAPQQARITVQDRSLRLQWQPPLLTTNDQLLGYQIYRQAAGEPLPIMALNPQPWQETGFEDFNLENGRSYSYWIRALIERQQQQVEGLATGALVATPQAGN